MCFLYAVKLSEYLGLSSLRSSDSSGSPPVEGTKAGISFEKFFLSSEIVQHSFLDKGLIIYQCDFALNFYAGSANKSIFKLMSSIQTAVTTPYQFVPVVKAYMWV